MSVENKLRPGCLLHLDTDQDHSFPHQLCPSGLTESQTEGLAAEGMR